MKPALANNPRNFSLSSVGCIPYGRALKAHRVGWVFQREEIGFLCAAWEGRGYRANSMVDFRGLCFQSRVPWQSCVPLCIV